MKRSNDRELNPANPVIFMGVGHAALASLMQLEEASAALRVRAYGPFGLLTMGSPREGVRATDFEWLSDVSAAGSLDSDAAGHAVDDPALSDVIATLFRRLHRDVPLASSDRSPRIRVTGYLLIDLSEPGNAQHAATLAKRVRHHEPGLDLTAVAITGRTAESRDDADHPWFEELSEMLRLQEAGERDPGSKGATNGSDREPMIQRLYVLDGCDTNASWIQKPEQMHRLAADFLMHHGLGPYREHLRRHERSQVTEGDNFRNVLGSFSCRQLRSDKDEIARRIANKIVQDKTFLLHARPLADDQAKALDDEAVELRETIKNILVATDTEGGPSSTELEHRDAQVNRAIQNTLERVCAHNPLGALQYFLKRFRPMLGQLGARSVLVDRMEARYRAGNILRRQVRDTYEPLSKWLPYGELLHWETPLKPTLPAARTIRASRPGNPITFLVGTLLAFFGLLTLLQGNASGIGVIGFIGGALAIAGVGLMTWPWGWVDHQPTVIAHDAEEPRNPPMAVYRMRRPFWFRGMGAGLAFCGAAAVVLQTQFSNWLTQRSIGFFVVLALWGLALFALPLAKRLIARMHLDNELPAVDGVEVRGEAGMRASVRVSLLVWCMLGWLVVFRDNQATWLGNDGLSLGLLAASAFTTLGVVLFMFPARGKVSLIHRTPELPNSLESGQTRSLVEPEISHNVDHLTAWVDHLLTDAKKGPRLEWAPTQHAANILDALAEKWQDQLAAAFSQSAERTYRAPLSRLADLPELWSQCIVDQLHEPTVGLDQPDYMFALFLVRRWLDAQSWEDLVSHLTLDPQWFDFYTTRICAPRWSKPRTEPNVDAAVIVVGNALWDVVSSLARPNWRHRMERMDWQDADSMIVIRVVQGLNEGWMSLPDLPLPKVAPRLDKLSYESNAARIGETRDQVLARLEKLAGPLRLMGNRDRRNRALKRLDEARDTLFGWLDVLSPNAAKDIAQAASRCEAELDVVTDEVGQCRRLDHTETEVRRAVDLLAKDAELLPQAELGDEVRAAIKHTMLGLDELFQDPTPWDRETIDAVSRDAYELLVHLLKDISRNASDMPASQRGAFTAKIIYAREMLRALGAELGALASLDELERAVAI